MDFKNSIFMYLIAGSVVVFVTIMSVTFMIKAYRNGLKIGMEKKKLNKVISSTAIFTIAPSIAILLTVLTLAAPLGMPLPWLRLSVIGAITYEVPAAQAVADSLGGTLSSIGNSPEGFATIAYVMTFGILIGVALIPFLVPKIASGMNKLKMKDEKWGKIFMDALFLGLISSFLGVAISGKTTDRVNNLAIDPTTGTIMVSVLTLLSSAVLMLILGVLIKKLKMKWLENYAIPICLLSSMGLAILYSAVLPASLFV